MMLWISFLIEGWFVGFMNILELFIFYVLVEMGKVVFMVMCLLCSVLNSMFSVISFDMEVGGSGWLEFFFISMVLVEIL